MQAENLINLLAVPSSDGCEGDNAEPEDSKRTSCGADPEQTNLERKENGVEVEVLGNIDLDLVKATEEIIPAENNLEVTENELDMDVLRTGVDLVKSGERDLPTAELKGDFMESSSLTEVTLKGKEVSSVAEDANCLKITEVQLENGCLKEKRPTGGQKREGSPVSSNSLSGNKKSRISVDEQLPSVKVMFNFLTSDSKRKLEELLQHWSEWHAKHRSSAHDSTGVLESGEQTYFPALRVGQNNSSAVSFWMDNRIGDQHNQEMTPQGIKSVPLYDRGFSWALASTDVSSNLDGLEVMDSSRCFNCGAYDHALRECPKPRDNAAVSKARKEHNSRRSQNSESRNPTRYYQDSSGGKFDGLKPGALDSETRKLLGLGELDPPPWLNRMREIGYPPGYLDPDDEDQPSGILIFGGEEELNNKEHNKVETEDGEILDTNFPEPPREKSPDPPRKMSVLFPGINAPIPENASETLWSLASSSNSYANRSHRRGNNSYNDLDSSYSFHMEGGIIIAEKSYANRGRWSPTSHDDSQNDRSYNNSRQGSPPGRFSSQSSYGGSRSSRRWDEDRRNDSYSSRHREREWDWDKDREDGHRSQRRR